jgi:sec-independent protein translocase protein TatB
MLDIGWTELLVIAVVAIIVIGPKELPRLMRTFGYYVGKMRRAAADFQRQFEDAARDTELDEVRRALQEFRTHSPLDPHGAPGSRPLMVQKPAQAQGLAKSPSRTSPKRPPKPKRSKRTQAAEKSAPRARKRPAKPRRGPRRKREMS